MTYNSPYLQTPLPESAGILGWIGKLVGSSEANTKQMVRSASGLCLGQTFLGPSDPLRWGLHVVQVGYATRAKHMLVPHRSTGGKKMARFALTEQPGVLLRGMPVGFKMPFPQGNLQKAIGSMKPPVN